MKNNTFLFPIAFFAILHIVSFIHCWYISITANPFSHPYATLSAGIQRNW